MRAIRADMVGILRSLDDSEVERYHSKQGDVMCRARFGDKLAKEFFLFSSQVKEKASVGEKKHKGSVVVKCLHPLFCLLAEVQFQLHLHK
jgi:hypothetical protein